MLCVNAEGDHVRYKVDELNVYYVTLIMIKEVCTDVDSVLICKYTCVLVDMG